MKGIIFNEFIELVDAKFGMEISEDIIDEVNPQSQGAYTEVGDYDHQELVELVVALSKKTNTDIEVLLFTFGHYLFDRLHNRYPEISQLTNNTFEYLQHVQEVIHLHVIKLYPKAEVPQFKFEYKSDTKLVMRYLSNRGFALVAKGLIQGCSDHFNESLQIEMVDNSDGAMVDATFTLIKGE